MGDILSKITKSQDLFCREYIIDFNGTRAYLVAYPNVKSEATARANASRLLTKDNINQRIKELIEERSKRVQIAEDDVIKELKEVAFAKVELSGKDKLKALELLGKHIGMFEDW